MESTSRRPGLHLASSVLMQSTNNQTGSGTSNMRSSSAPPSVSLDQVPITASGVTADVNATTPTEANTVPATTSPAEKPNNPSFPAMTPEMRNIALQRLAEGVPPSALGTVLPSPHPEYLQALFLGPMSQVDLFLRPRAQDPNNPTNGVNDNDYVVYFDDWSVEEVVDRAMAKQQQQQQHTTTTTTTANAQEPDGEENDRLEKVITVRRTQNRAARQFNLLRNKVHNWSVLDDLRVRKYSSALEVIVNDPVAQQPGALENLVTHWRTRLGWIDPSVGYWYDATPALLGDQRLRFVAYGPTFSPITAQVGISVGADLIAAANGSRGNNNLVKYFWSDISGIWKTEDGLVREQEDIKRERNAWLTNAINRIEREFYDDLVMEGAGFVQRYMTGGHHEVTDWPTEEPMSWSGGAGHPGQKPTRRRRIKKQTPRRGLGSVSFLPEDGGLMPLQALARAAAAEKDIPVSSERDTPLATQKELPEFLQRNPAKPAEEGQTTKGLTPAIEKPVEIPVARPTEVVSTKSKKKGGKKSKTSQTVKKAPTQKRKRSQNDEGDVAPATTRVTRSTSAQPVGPELPAAESASVPQSPSKKKRKIEQTVEQEPEPVATRKSSRIAKRKADSVEPEDANVKSSAENPSKKRKTDSKPPTTTRYSRQRTASVEPSRPRARPPKAQAAGTSLSTIAEVPDSDEPAPLSQQPQAVVLAAASAVEANRAASSTPSLEEDLISIHTTPQVTPHKPTSTTLTTTPITAADFPAMTAVLRKELMDQYPFLANVSTETPASPPPTESKAAQEAGTDTDADTDAPPSRQDDWLSFLSFFGRDASTVASINAFFGREGSSIREAQYLEALRRVIGGLRRVVGKEDGGEEEEDDGEEKFVWV